MATLHLPDDPNLQHLRNEARDLQRGVRSGDAQALELLRSDSPVDVAPDDRVAYPLAAAQRVLARAYGFASWPRLRAHLDVIDRWRWDPRPEAAAGGADDHDRFLELACLVYDRYDSPDRRADAGRLLAADPGLSGRSIWAAATAGDPGAIARHLAADPSLAVRAGGPQRWEPLMYLAYSRLDTDLTADAVRTSARLLLDAGGDPDTGRLWRGLTTPFTLLTGCFGEGELGPVRQPRHRYSLALAGVLLEAGADPDDGQALYNRMFSRDDDHLELLFTFGLGSQRPGLARPWRRRLGPALEGWPQILSRQLGWAIGHGFTARLGLLLDHGIDPGTPLPDGRSPVEAALALGQREMVDLLAAAGARVPRLAGVRAYLGAALAGDGVTVAEMAADDPALPAAALAKRPDLVARACEAGRLEALPLLLGLGFDVDARRRGATALHRAAWDGDVEAVQALLGHGADAELRDEEFDATPRGWAEHAGQDGTRALLTPDPA